MAKEVFCIEMLPAGHGDALWIEYGRGKNLRRILIDGGTVATYAHLDARIKKIPANERFFELVVLTHVDADHVEGLVRLFADKPLLCSVDKVLFNGWRQMNPQHRMLGALQGEFLSALLARRAPDAWDMDAPPWIIPDAGPLPVLELPGGIKLTLLSPSVAKLAAMAREWKKAVSGQFEPGDLEKAWAALSKQKRFLPARGLLGTTDDLDLLLRQQFSPDAAKANGSSIAFLAEYGSKSALFLADAHPDTIAASLRRLCAERQVERLTVGAVKVAHHGSKNNTSVELLKLVDSPTYLISTNGDHFGHPDAACMARIVKHARPKKFVFNYETEFTKPWIAPDMQSRHDYEVQVRAAQSTSVKVTL